MCPWELPPIPSNGPPPLSSSSTPSDPFLPTIILHIPAYGVLYVPHPHPQPYPPPPPPPPTELVGELEVVIPAVLGARHIKGVRISLRSVCILKDGIPGGVEMFTVEEELSGEVVLGAGSHRLVGKCIYPAEV
jgi:hypothetical protein